MNIREIERQLGIPRANIRYYEKEGLLHPARGSNNSAHSSKRTRSWRALLFIVKALT